MNCSYLGIVWVICLRCLTQRIMLTGGINKWDLYPVPENERWGCHREQKSCRDVGGGGVGKDGKIECNLCTQVPRFWHSSEFIIYTSENCVMSMRIAFCMHFTISPRKSAVTVTEIAASCVCGTKHECVWSPHHLIMCIFKKKNVSYLNWSCKEKNWLAKTRGLMTWCWGKFWLISLVFNDNGEDCKCKKVEKNSRLL